MRPVGMSVGGVVGRGRKAPRLSAMRACVCLWFSIVVQGLAPDPVAGPEQHAFRQRWLGTGAPDED